MILEGTVADGQTVTVSAEAGSLTINGVPADAAARRPPAAPAPSTVH